MKHPAGDAPHGVGPVSTFMAGLSARYNAARRQGRRGAHGGSGARPVLLGGLSPALLAVVQPQFAGREEELARLAAFATAPEGAPSYLYCQAEPWAGKSALLAQFATAGLPDGVDVAHYIISRRLGTDRRNGFVLAVADQLIAASGGRGRLDDGWENQSTPLHALYEAAASACVERGRRLLLIVDGLDEDADVGINQVGIAGVLPKVPPPGMRVIVAGRRHPGAPADLDNDHPLRLPSLAWRVPASPAALAIRDTVMAELHVLLDDPGIGQKLLGLLVVAQGGLTAEDMAALIDGAITHDVRKRLRGVTGRSLSPTRAGLLDLDVTSAARAEASRETFALAHDTLFEVATEELGQDYLDERIKDLHRWARGYRRRSWPAESPDFPLTGYARFLHRRNDLPRLTALVLDANYQVRLAERSGHDVALAHLDLIGPSGTDDSTLAARVDSAAATAAASRTMLLLRERPLPPSVAQVTAMLGDVPRARALAAASGRAVDKAVNLADLADLLRSVDWREAVVTARDAGARASVALREAGYLSHEAGLAEGAAARAAVILLEAAHGSRGSHGSERSTSPRNAVRGGLPLSGEDGSQLYAEGLTLLRSTAGTGSDRVEACARAVEFLDAEDAEDLLDEIEGLAEKLADEALAYGTSGAGAVQLWQTVASVAPGRADGIHDRALAYAAEVWEAVPALENLEMLAGAASLVAQARPAQARELVDAACRYLEHVLEPGSGRLPDADVLGESGFRDALAAFSRAVEAVEAPPETVALALHLAGRVLSAFSLYEEGRRGTDARAAENSGVRGDGDEGGDGGEEQDFAEAERLADRALRHAREDSPDDAERLLQQALGLLPVLTSRSGRVPVWLADLAGALVRTGTEEGTELAGSLAALTSHPADRTRVHAAMALAHADSLQADEAHRHAREAHRAAQATGLGAVWPYAVQALAAAGDVAAAVRLLVSQEKPADVTRSSWRQTDRAARIAAAAEIGKADPVAASELVLPLFERLKALGLAGRSKRPLVELVELRPAFLHLSSEHRQRFDQYMEDLQGQGPHGVFQPRSPEEALTHAFLRLSRNDDVQRQLDWLTTDMANRGTKHFPTEALAVLYAALGETDTAVNVACLLRAPHRRATALAAVASHLVGIPQRPSPLPEVSGAASFTRSIQHLALNADGVPPDGVPPGSISPATAETARGVANRALVTTGWYQALPVLARLAPAAVLDVGEIAAAHLRGPAAGLA
ncbi:hypothetical protein [Streptomyces sp. NPDC056144]|uniref:hypothetical protein n=1 Tax=unclassified Streptomyces TaxID=2593676 RepID=UPI0035DE32A6